MRGTARTLTALLAAALLAGCALGERGGAPAATPGADETRQGTGARDGDERAAPRPQTPPDDDPARLVGLAAGAITGRLGEPAMVRRDGTAQIWHYRAIAEGGRACVLHLFLYPDGNTPRVTHAEARSGLDPLVGNAGRACLRAVVAGRQTS
ncbi:MAG: hypothetical protein AB7N54_03215 [Alphaproteobacteria bacterium]